MNIDYAVTLDKKLCELLGLRGEDLVLCPQSAHHSIYNKMFPKTLSIQLKTSTNKIPEILKMFSSKKKISYGNIA